MEKYKLIFEENFNYNGRPDAEIWHHEVGEKWSNNEIQCYVDDENHSYVKDSKLHLLATHEDSEHCAVKSARLSTYGKKAFQYGRFIVKAKMPKGRGSWPAIWFLAMSKKEFRWPKCGEIDLLEYAGNRMKTVSCAIHTQSYNHRINTQKNKRTDLPTASDSFHEYMLDWTKDHLIFYVDHNEVMRVEKKPDDTFDEWPFDQPYYLIINLAVGGWYGGEVSFEDLPFHFEIDYVKVYQEI